MSEVFALLGFSWAVVTSRKFVRSFGSAVHTDAPATASQLIVEKRMIECCNWYSVPKPKDRKSGCTTVRCTEL
jgi:hypothetical protein